MSDEQIQKVKVWDAPVRVFHWLLVIAFAFSAFSAFQDKFGIYADIHLYAGLSVLSLVVWRLMWGFVGSDTARFSQFVKGPKTTIEYTKTAFDSVPYRSTGHNPLGAVSVVLMLLLLLVQAALGLYATDAMFFEGPFSHTISSRLSEDLTEVHEWTGYTLLGLIGLHILVVALYGLVRRVNLIGPMITGWSRHAEQPLKMTNAIFGFALLFLVGGAVWWWVFG
ncbi:cytochrome b/b6 domain-containing protein [Kordiimonas sp.]|uniref:cytochrome b/b6 domain-containing protein n=1 Tax=Kordiimonas sp. TaxID=1970157 RepID=UPI003B52612C